jgi:hypothetical protein
MDTIYKIAFSFTLFAFAPVFAHAASLNFSPSSGMYAAGTTFVVSVYVGSSDQVMNAASGVVSFPWDKLEVISLSKAGSIFSLWPVEPSFSNSNGTVNFEGIVPNPGYTGANGKILTITFRARSAGNANMSFSSGSVLANDGTGANILNSLRVAVFTLTGTGETTTLPKTEVPTTASNNMLGITSSTHPDQSKWYANSAPEFSWNVPEGTLEVRTLIGKSPSGIPSVSYIPPITNKKVDELSDGTYYFSIQARTTSGWGAVSRYRVNIDTTPPKIFSVTFPHGNTGWESQPVVYFNTTDSESGISHYDIKIGNSAKLIKSAPLVDSNPYVLPPQLPGTYSLIVMAIDNSGNMRNSLAEFTIEAIEAPTITNYPEILEKRDILKMSGTTYPNSDISVFIREGDTLISEEYTRSNTFGDFVLVATKDLDVGSYTITARVKDSLGAQSTESLPVIVSIRPALVEGVIGFVLKYLSVAVLLLLVFGGIFWVGARLWFRIPNTIAHMRREAREAEKTSERMFKILRSGVERHVARLKKADRKLTKEEREFLEEFENKLGEAEELIIKEIRDILE